MLLEKLWWYDQCWQNHFLLNLLLTDKQVPNICKYFANAVSVNGKLWKTKETKIVQSVGFLGKLLGSLLKIDLPLTKNVLILILKV